MKYIFVLKSTLYECKVQVSLDFIYFFTENLYKVLWDIYYTDFYFHFRIQFDRFIFAIRK